MEGGGDFYIYLDSDFNKKEFKNNKNFGFTNIITPNIALNGKYEVGLRNIIFTPDFYIVKKDDSAFGMKLKISFYDEAYRFIHGATYEYTPSDNISADNIEEFILKYDKDFHRFLKIHKIASPNYKETFVYKKNGEPMIFNPLEINKQLFGADEEKYNHATWRFQMGAEISKCFGVLNRDFLTEPTFITSPSLPKPPSLFYIYSDIVSSSFMGGQQVNLLDVFPLKQSYAKTTNFTMYKNVSASSLDSISIKITDHNGYDPKLKDDVNVVLVVHFKRVFD